MFKFFVAGTLAVLAGFNALTASAQTSTLSLEEAVRLAITADDPAYSRFETRAQAKEDLSVADAQLDDPKVNLRAQNFPVDSLAFNQEPMTQFRLGISQELPRGDTLKLKGNKRLAEASVFRAERAALLDDVALQVRLSWLDLYLTDQELGQTRKAKNEIDDLIDALAASFSQGQLTGQDVLRAELELTLLDDKIAELEQAGDIARANLSRFIGGNAQRPLPNALPPTKALPTMGVLETALTNHPRVEQLSAQIDVQRSEVAIAGEAYKPSWSVEGGYGLRGAGRPDFATIGVSFSVPLFTEKRQDRRASAALKERAAAELDRSALLLDLRRDLARNFADWTRLKTRVDLYDKAVLTRANDTVDASINAYGGGLTDFPELIRSQLAVLDAETKRLRLKVAGAKARARISYLIGDLS